MYTAREGWLKWGRERQYWNLLDLTLWSPVVQAPLGACDGPRLAGMVSRAGALGCLTLHGVPAEQVRRRLRRVRKITHRPILVAMTTQWDREDVLEACLEAGMRHFQVFWWNGPRLAPRIHAAGGKVFWQVGTTHQANDACEIGVDALIAQGTEAGGQVRSPFPLRQLLTDLLVATGEKIPIVAGGGLADRQDVTRVLSWGASAALLGTRFLLSEESNSLPCHKIRLSRANTEDLTLDPRMVGDWPCAPRRRLITARNEDKSSLFAGRGLSRIRQVLSVAEIVRRLTPRSVPEPEGF